MGIFTVKQDTGICAKVLCATSCNHTSVITTCIYFRKELGGGGGDCCLSPLVLYGNLEAGAWPIVGLQLFSGNLNGKNPGGLVG